MKTHPPIPFWVRVPASTANLGPGFDTLALALNLYNYVAVTPGNPETPDPFVAETINTYHKSRNLPSKNYCLVVHGQVPRSRGLGSSATIRLGILAALDKLNGRKLDLPWLIETASTLEGHPDNITAAALGGFIVCGGKKPASTKVSSRLKFVAAIPQVETSTKTARSLLPAQVPFQDAITNLRNASRISSAFFSKKYDEAAGAFHDRLHQPYRSSLVAGLDSAIAQAEKAGALGAFLRQAGHRSVDLKILSADNSGLRIVKSLP
jgi:homoserine kinase